MDYRKAIFVFGSNEGGWHGAGAAKFALTYKGAILRQPVGRQGQSYAIPTKDATIKHTLPLHSIKNYVDEFVIYAETHPELEFQVTRIGCGLAGLKDEDIAPMFFTSPSFMDIQPLKNCWFDEAWKPYLPEGTKYWGTF